jgi:hypothetical protein
MFSAGFYLRISLFDQMRNFEPREPRKNEVTAFSFLLMRRSIIFPTNFVE